MILECFKNMYKPWPTAVASGLQYCRTPDFLLMLFLLHTENLLKGHDAEEMTLLIGDVQDIGCLHCSLYSQNYMVHNLLFSYCKGKVGKMC